jgi:hypothetical protein
MFPFPFRVDPEWYENYWYSERPRPKRRSFPVSLVRFAVLVVLLTGGSAVLSQFHVHRDLPGLQDWEQE